MLYMKTSLLNIREIKGFFWGGPESIMGLCQHLHQAQ
jgi:hypothetical protein